MGLLDCRLQAVLSLIPQGSILLDIGTDHCKLPAEGLLSGRLAGAYAADIREGPLAAAKKQLNGLGLADQIPLYLSDGLRSIPMELGRNFVISTSTISSSLCLMSLSSSAITA